MVRSLLVCAVATVLICAALVRFAGAPAASTARALPSHVQVAAVQIPVGTLDSGREASPETLLPYITRAGADGVDLLVFPEYAMGVFDVKGPLVEGLVGAARANHVNVVVGGWEKLPGYQPGLTPPKPRTYANCALVIGREGKVMGKYHKAHQAVGCAPYGWPPRPGETSEWTMKAGDSVPVFDLDIGRIGVLSCYDGYFFEMYEIMSLKGAEILVWLNGRPTVEDYIARTASQLTCTAVVSANNAGGQGSMVCDYPGAILARTDRPGEAYLTATLNMGALRVQRRNNRMFHQRRPELYRDLLRDYPVWERYPDIPAYEYPKAG